MWGAKEMERGDDGKYHVEWKIDGREEDRFNVGCHDCGCIGRLDGHADGRMMDAPLLHQGGVETGNYIEGSGREAGNGGRHSGTLIQLSRRLLET